LVSLVEQRILDNLIANLGEQFAERTVVKTVDPLT